MLFKIKRLEVEFRKTIVEILEKHFVPMKKFHRFEWERFLLNSTWLPFKDLICDCWHKEIKRKYSSAQLGAWK